MAASSNPKRNYHVFLSFRGTDVRNNFLGHLYAALDQKGLHTFMDKEEVRIGEQISPALVKAIEESRAAVIIFSEDYASSPWCLEELAKIMECKKQRHLKVFPVFYKVKPREVREGRETYARAMAKHESKFGKDSKKVTRWKKALFNAGSLSGWDFQEGDEAGLIQCIVKELLIHLDRTLLHVAKYPVGIDSRVQELISQSQKESGDNDVLMIGLWGPGGIGKTTIAKAIYNAIERQFQGSSFLARVSETSNQSNSLVSLQEKLLSEILSDRNLMVYSVDGGISLIRERLCCKKVLLVLDDVDGLDQLNAIAGEGDWFGKGSRIIVTSRDKHLLTSHGINCVYEVKALDDVEALVLFCRHAFPNSRKDEIRRDLINTALSYANGLPLALEVLGSLLCGRKEPAWRSTLHKLSKSPDRTINRVLKTSFDGLEDNEKEVFLDIACFFKGKRTKDIKKIIDSCGFDTTIGIEILIERALIKYENETLQMHDLVQLMGKDIVNQECPDDPTKRSRLWLFEDVQDILCEVTGTNAVKNIVLDLHEPEEITISPDAFANMKRLRMLILKKVHISSQGPVRLPRELRWVEWSNAPDLDFGSGLRKLVGLHVRDGQIKQLGGNFKDFGKLKSIVLARCKSLTSVPDLSSVPNLEMLNLNWCNNLVEVHQSVGYLDKLESLLLYSCSNLSIFPDTLKTTSLQNLILSCCYKLEKFPDIPEKMERLRKLWLMSTAIKELPASIENLVSLEWINLNGSKNLAKLPSSIYKLKNLRTLTLQNCWNLVMFPKNLEDSTNSDGDVGFPNLSYLLLDGCDLSEVEFLESFSSFPKLKTLYLSENKFSHLPTCINKYDGLESLHVNKCRQLQEIPQLPSNVSYLSANSCKSLQKLPDLSSLSSCCLVVHLASCSELFRNGVNIADVLSPERFSKMKAVNILLMGGEMPGWFLHCEEGSISFMVPKDLYDKILGLALCVILGLEEGKEVNASCEVQIFVNGERIVWQSSSFYSLESDHVWLAYYPPRGGLYEVEKHLQNDWSQFQVCLRPSGATVKKCGFRLMCEQQEDDVRVVLQHNQPIETNWILEERDQKKTIQ